MALGIIGKIWNWLWSDLLPEEDIIGVRVIIVIEDDFGHEHFQSVTVNVPADSDIDETILRIAGTITDENAQIQAPGSPPGTVTEIEVAAVVEGGFPSPSITLG